MGQRELELLGEELLDVWSADVVGLGDLNDLQDLDIALAWRCGLWETRTIIPERT